MAPIPMLIEQKIMAVCQYFFMACHDSIQVLFQNEVFPRGDDIGPERIGINGKVAFNPVPAEFTQGDAGKDLFLRVQLRWKKAVIPDCGPPGAAGRACDQDENQRYNRDGLIQFQPVHCFSLQ